MSQELEQTIERMIARVDEAHIALRNERVVDLGTLEKDVNVLCVRMRTLPPLEARRLQPFMGDLIARLDELAGDLENFKAKHGD